MEQKILVSILMPICNVEQYLAKCLDSVFSQTYPYIEYVFVDDCSSDSSLTVLRTSISKYVIADDRYTIICQEKNEGVAKARIECLAHAKGDYIFFVDSDDWIEEDAVEQMVAATKGGKVDIVGCDFSKDFLSGETTYHHECYADTCIENMIRCLDYQIATVLWKLLIRKSLFDNFSINPNINIGEDYIISIKLYFYAKSFVALHKALYHYVQYNQNRLSFQSARSIKDHILCVKEIEMFLRENGLYDRSVEHQLNLRKFNIKSNFLTKKLFDCEAYQNTFPEVDRIWRYIGYTKKESIKFWLAEHHLYLILRFINNKYNGSKY